METNEVMKRQDLSWLTGARHRKESVTIESLATQFVNQRAYRVSESDLMGNPGDAAITKEVGEHQWLRAPKVPAVKAAALSAKFLKNRLEVLKGQLIKWARTLQKLWKKPLTDDAKEAVNETLDAIFSPDAWPVSCQHSVSMWGVRCSSRATYSTASPT